MSRSRVWGMRVALGAAVWAFCAAPSLAHECIKPAAPTLPDKGTSDAATRNAVTAQIEAYIGATNVYLSCLEQADAAARAEAERIIQGWEAPVMDIQVITD